MAILGILALLVFGEQKLPGIMRQAGRVMREVQNTSQSFIREMERAADVNEPQKPPPATPPQPDDATNEAPQ
jgi:Sec-independent protein translocase protein TatA